MQVPRLILAAAAGLLHIHDAAALRTAPERSRPQAADLLADFDAPKAMFQVGERLRPTLLHFMFELKDMLIHPGIWGEYFDSAQPGTLMAWAHCTDYHACKNDYNLQLLNVRLVPTTWSVRGADLMTPFVHMMRIAMQETKHLADSGVMEKFLVISDSTLPVKPFSYTYWDLAASPASDICISSTDQWAHGTVDGSPVALVKHHQWVALNRSDAAVLVRDWRAVTQGKGWNVPLKDGRWAGQNRSVPRTSFDGGTWYTATDEEAVWALLHGPMELRFEGDLEQPLQVFMRRRCHTYVAFPHDVEPTTHLASRTPHSLLQLEAKAEAKFDHTKITLQLLKDPDSKMSVPPGVWHPFLMEALGDRSLGVLRRSPYLFARKFSACAKLHNYSEIMLRG